MILENSGKYEVMIVNESARALPAAWQFQPSVMLLDVDMPGKSGGDLAREAAYWRNEAVYPPSSWPR